MPSLINFINTKEKVMPILHKYVKKINLIVKD